ncbi:UDP-glycosyltransferase 73C5-like [Musa acuminata AAA Group]|uniref:UDP-glycosyltransferase 73C5-like n=1 Tax=Musa acuminata AAA Group TaxID=214697 RepID=UPI0031CFD9C9
MSSPFQSTKQASGKTLSPQGRGTQSSIMDGHREGMPHFVLVPLMTQGHMIPMTDLALLLADRGVLVSFITTPCNAARIKDTIHRARDSGLPIRFVELPFPGAEEGLAEGWENIDDLPRAELYVNFFRATYLLQQPLELYLQGHQQPYPSAIISDFCLPWTLKVARNLRIPRIAFSSMSCFALLCTFNIWRYKVYDGIAEEHQPFTVPGLREQIEVTRAQASEFFPGPIFENIAKDVREAEFAADGIVVNSFQDLEHAFIEGYQEAMGKIVWTTGPLFLRSRSVADMATRGRKASIDVDHCLSWLGTMKPRSVLYVGFGSLTRTDPSQLMDIGLGLEASDHPFIWVMRYSEESAEKIEQWLAGGFEERVGSRALIIKGWAPQLMILSHPAIGGFLTHCGWNSILEAISAGIPMITWPHFTDQFLNERMIVDVLKVGVPVGVKEPNFIGMQRSETMVSRNDVERSVRTLMDEGKEGEERRQRAERLGEKANAAMKEGRGSSHSNVTRLIEHFSGNATV